MHISIWMKQYICLIIGELKQHWQTNVFKQYTKEHKYVDYENQDYYFQKKQYNEHFFQIKI